MKKSVYNVIPVYKSAAAHITFCIFVCMYVYTQNTYICRSIYIYIYIYTCVFVYNYMGEIMENTYYLGYRFDCLKANIIT